MFVLLLLIGLLAVACDQTGESNSETTMTTSNEPPAVEPTIEPVALRLPMGYIPDPQYAPFYVAVERGYFAEEGIELTFDYSFETDGMALVGAGELPLAIVSGEQVLLARAQGLPVVYVYEWFQRYPIAVISKAAAGITEPADLVGRTVGLPGFFGASYVGYVGLLSANEIAQESVTAEDIGFTQVEALLADRVEAVVGYVNNEPIQLAALGEEVNVLNVADYIDMVANGIITNETTIAENPELIGRFLRALTRGLEDTLADPTAAYEISKKYVEGLDDSRIGVLQASLPLWEAETLGMTDAEAWRQTETILIEMGLLDAPLSDLEESFSNQFVQELQP
jgi:NitT/TauT family transport system substrate-binding protein